MRLHDYLAVNRLTNPELSMNIDCEVMNKQLFK